MLTSIITWIIVGGIAGFLAEQLIGGWLFAQLHIAVGTGLLNDIITAFVGAAVLLLVIRILRGR